MSEFLADCPFSHRLPDDPIVFPGLPGASHMHSFFGATSTNAHTNLNSLQNGRSNCNPSVDLSSYWVPTLYNAANQPVEPNIVTFYYLGEGIANPGAIQSMPLGMRIVAKQREGHRTGRDHHLPVVLPAWTEQPGRQRLRQLPG
nr:hypothetical protein GCM10020092_052490 [Actinoplanes digitatis]